MYWISCHNLMQIPSRKKLKRIPYQMWLISYHKHIGKTILSGKFNYILVYIIIIYDYISDIYIFIYVYSGKGQKCRRQKNRYQASTITPRHHNTQINVNQASKIRRQIVQSTLLRKVLFNTVTNRIENQDFVKCSSSFLRCALENSLFRGRPVKSLFLKNTPGSAGVKKLVIFTLLWGGPQVEGTRKSRWSRVGTSKIISQPILDLYPVICLVR